MGCKRMREKSGQVNVPGPEREYAIEIGEGTVVVMVVPDRGQRAGCRSRSIGACGGACKDRRKGRGS